MNDFFTIFVLLNLQNIFGVTYHLSDQFLATWYVHCLDLVKLKTCAIKIEIWPKLIFCQYQKDVFNFGQFTKYSVIFWSSKWIILYGLFIPYKLSWWSFSSYPYNNKTVHTFITILHYYYPNCTLSRTRPIVDKH